MPPNPHVHVPTLPACAQPLLPTQVESDFLGQGEGESGGTGSSGLNSNRAGLRVLSTQPSKSAVSAALGSAE